MFCSRCGKEVSEGVSFCPNCGETLNRSSMTKSKNVNASTKNRTVALLLALFLGAVGAHRFYVGKIGTAILTIILSCCFGVGWIWALVDLIFILCGNFKDKSGKLILDWNID